ncbi:MAG: hypothetical protein M3R47_09035 [Chloroflexota bacterium]|nr:hypothetical protein [Chloroflexota bacterium]
MNRTQRRIWFLMLMVALLVIPSTVVFAKELGLLTITGPGIKGEVSLNNHDDMMKLEQSGFFDQARFVKPPENLGKGYNITAHLNLDGKLVPMIEMVYYPAKEGQPGYVHYTGRLNGESLQTVDQWGQMAPPAETALRNLMTANKITLQPAVVVAPAVVEQVAVEPAKSEEQSAVQPASAPSIASTAIPQQAYYVGIALAASILILLGAGFVLRRRASSHPTT